MVTVLALLMIAYCEGWTCYSCHMLNPHLPASFGRLCATCMPMYLCPPVILNHVLGVGGRAPVIFSASDGREGKGS